jgi:hypothetical protein
VDDNIFDEITADLRRDRLSEAWSKYGRYIIGTAVGIVLVIAVSIGIGTYQQNQEEQASARYDALQAELETADAEARIIRLLSFAAAEDNGYGALARMSATLLQAGQGQLDNALAGFDALADDGSLPDTLRDFARLQAAIVLLDGDADLDEIEQRLARLMLKNNGLQPMAREVLALAYIANDKPLEARAELKQLQDDAATGYLTKERVAIILASLRGQLLSPEAPATDEQAAEEGDGE